MVIILFSWKFIEVFRIILFLFFVGIIFFIEIQFFFVFLLDGGVRIGFSFLFNDKWLLYSLYYISYIIIFKIDGCNLIK